MKKKEWELVLEDGQHTIVFERKYSGKRIFVDGLESAKIKNRPYDFWRGISI